MSHRMHESSTYDSGPAPTWYGVDYLGPVPTGSKRSGQSELALTRPGISQGAALMAGGVAVLGLAWLIYTTRQK